MKGELFKKEEKNVSAPPVLLRNYVALRILDLNDALSKFIVKMKSDKLDYYTYFNLLNNIIFVRNIFVNENDEILAKLDEYITNNKTLSNDEIIEIALHLINLAYKKRLTNIFQLSITQTL